MIRQAQTYFVGAMSGTVLIGAAIAVFVVLVSAQVFHEWPVSSLESGGSAKTEVSDARSVAHAPAQPAASSIAAARANARAAATPVHRSTSQPNHAAKHNGAANGAELAVAKPDTSAGAENPLSSGSEPASGSPSPSDSGSQGSPHPTSPAPSSPAPTSGGGAETGGGSGGGGEKPTGGGGGTETAPTPAPTTSKGLAETVNKTVTGVDETVTGGTLGEAGVTHVTEEVVNGVAGPESVVGGTVDEVGTAVEGLLGGGK